MTLVLFILPLLYLTIVACGLKRVPGEVMCGIGMPFIKKPNSEYRVEAALRERDIETYLPEISCSEKNKKTAKRPFFPCYLFMKINLEKVGFSKWHLLLGLRHIVAYGRQPVKLTETTINLIRAKVNKIESSVTSRRMILSQVIQLELRMGYYVVC